MNREIKFRAWAKDVQTMSEWDYIKDVWNLDGLESEDSEIMQFTGLRDKNGKEIYEGDFVQFYHKEKGYVIGDIVFESGAFIIGSDNLPDSYSILLEEADSEKDCMTIEIKGNKFENPEILDALGRKEE